MKLRRVGGQEEAEVEVLAQAGSALRVRLGTREVSAEFEPLPDGSAILRVGSRHYRVAGARRADALLVTVGPCGFEFRPVAAKRSTRSGPVNPELTAPMPGKVLKVLVAEGVTVSAGEPLFVLEAMKMETVISAETAATIKKVRVAAGQMVEGGAVLVELSPTVASSGPESAPPDP